MISRSCSRAISSRCWRRSRRHRDARRILKRRQQVHEPGAFARPWRSACFERVDVSMPCVVDGNRQVARLLVLPGGQRAHERGRLGHDRVAVVERDAPDQMQALQRARQDDHVFGADVDAAAAPGARRRSRAGPAGLRVGPYGSTSRPSSRIAREKARCERLERVRSAAGCPPPKPIRSAPMPSEAGLETARSAAESQPVSQPGRVAGMGRVASAIGANSTFDAGQHRQLPRRRRPNALRLRCAELRRCRHRCRDPRPGSRVASFSAAIRVCGWPCSTKSRASASTRRDTTAACCTRASTTRRVRSRRACASRASASCTPTASKRASRPTAAAKSSSPVNEAELPRLENLLQRGQANGVEGLEMIGPERLREIEPHCVGVKALFSPNTGIVDYSRVVRAYADDVATAGGEVLPGYGVERMSDRPGRRGPADHGRRGRGATRGGLRRACTPTAWRACRARRPIRASCPFRGDYWVLRPDRRDLATQPDLPGARSVVSVSRRPLHAAHRRRRGLARPERGAGVFARGLRPPGRTAARPRRSARLPRLPEAGGASSGRPACRRWCATSPKKRS